MIIIGLFWFGWSVCIFSLKQSPELQYYFQLSEKQASSALLFNLLYAGLSTLAILLVYSIELVSQLDLIVQVLMVVGTLISLRLLIKG